MADGWAGQVFSTIANRAHARADEDRQKAEADRQQQIGLYGGVLKDPNATAEQRSYAAQQLNKLYQVKGKDGSPFDKIAGFLNHVGDHIKQGKTPDQVPAQPQGQAPQGQAPQGAQQQPPGQGNPLGGGQTMGGAGQDQPQVNPAQRSIADKVLGKAAKGLATGLELPGKLLQPQHLPNLVPINAEAFPSGEQSAQAAVDMKVKMANALANAHEKYTGEKMSGEAFDQLIGVKPIPYGQSAMSKVSYTGEMLQDAINSAGAQGGVDAYGQPIKGGQKYKILSQDWMPEDYNGDGPIRLNVAPTGGETFPSLNANNTAYKFIDGKWQPMGTIRVDRTTDKLVPVKSGNDWYMQKVPVTTHYQTPSGAPEFNEQEQKKSLPELHTRGEAAQPTASTPKAQKKSLSPVSAPSAGPSTKGMTKLGGVPAGQVNATQQRDTPINVAGTGLQEFAAPGNLDVFKNQGSIDRLRDYFVLNNRLVEDSGHGNDDPSSLGNIAGYYTGIKQASLQQAAQATAKAYADLTDKEKEFVSRYYYLMGVWGGMRKATGGNASQWAFHNLAQEIPNPASNPDYKQAAQKMRLMEHELKQAAEPNLTPKPVSLPDLNSNEPSNMPAPRSIKTAKDYLNSIGQH